MGATKTTGAAVATKMFSLTGVMFPTGTPGGGIGLATFAPVGGIEAATATEALFDLMNGALVYWGSPASPVAGTTMFKGTMKNAAGVVVAFVVFAVEVTA